MYTKMIICKLLVIILGPTSFLLLLDKEASAQQQPLPEQVPEVQKILKQWESMESEIKTARFTLDRFLFYAKNPDKAPQRVEFEQLITDRIMPLIQLEYSLKDLDIATNNFGNSKISEKLPQEVHWSTFDVVDNKEQILNTATSSSVNNAKEDKEEIIHTTRVKTKQNQNIRYIDANKAAVVMNRQSAILKYSIKTLRFVPDVANLRKRNDLSFKIINDMRAQLRSKAYSIEFDQITGFVFKMTKFSRSGSPIKEILQFKPYKTEEGIELPSMTVTYSYSNKGDSIIRLFLIHIPKDITLNEKFSKNVFQVLVPKGTTISNISKDGKIVGQKKTTISETDVLSFSKEIPDFVAQNKPENINGAGSLSLIWIIFFNVFAVTVILLLIIWNRKKNLD